MDSRILLPEPISKNIFEQYVRLIDKIRSDISDGYHSEDQMELFSRLSFLDNVVNGIERSLQDLNSNNDIYLKEQITNAVTECLASWILVLASWDRDPLIISALSYNFCAALYLLEKYSNENHVDIIRYLGKLESTIAKSEFLSRLNKERFMEEVYSGQLDDFSYDEYLDHVKSIPQFDYRRIDPIEMSDYSKKNIIEIGISILTRYQNDFFRIKKFVQDFSDVENVEVIRERINSLNIWMYFEELFTFDDKFEDVVWEIKIEISDPSDTYEAAQSGFLLWSFSKALESIGDIEIQLKECGNGSRWFLLKMRIKSIAAKVDLVDVLNKSRQAIESSYTKTSTDEMRKFEVEKDKLSAEAEKLRKESANMMDSDSAKILQELTIQDKILDLQKRKLKLKIERLTCF